MKPCYIIECHIIRKINGTSRRWRRWWEKGGEGRLGLYIYIWRREEGYEIVVWYMCQWGCLHVLLWAKSWCGDSYLICRDEYHFFIEQNQILLSQKHISPTKYDIYLKFISYT